jgi:hypothetical protein
MDPLAFKIERDAEAGVLVASGDDSEGERVVTERFSYCLFRFFKLNSFL